MVVNPRSRRPRRIPLTRFVALLAVMGLAGCSGPGTPSSLGSVAASRGIPNSTAGEPMSTSGPPTARTFTVSLPDGWLGVDVTPAGLSEMAARLQPTWPAVTQALETAASGGPSPFKSGQTLLVYDLRTQDLTQYPTGFNVAESRGDIECETLDLEAGYRSQGILDVRVDYLDLPVGRVARVSGRIAGGPKDLFGATYVVVAGGRSYQPYVETLWDLRGQFEPIFDGIVGSLQVTAPLPTPSLSPDLPFTTFPHDDLALEARMPQHALGRPLCTWSVHGAAAFSVVGSYSQLLKAILHDLHLPDGALTLGVAGRVNRDDPPFIVSAYQYAGATQQALVKEFAGWPGEVRNVGAKTVYVTQGPNSPGHAEGLDYYYPTGNVIYQIKTGDATWFEDVLSQLP
jgi:hypothetical protein